MSTSRIEIACLVFAIFGVIAEFLARGFWVALWPFACVLWIANYRSLRQQTEAPR